MRQAAWNIGENLAQALMMCRSHAGHPVGEVLPILGARAQASQGQMPIDLGCEVLQDLLKAGLVKSPPQVGYFSEYPDRQPLELTPLGCLIFYILEESCSRGLRRL